MKTREDIPMPELLSILADEYEQIRKDDYEIKYKTEKDIGDISHFTNIVLNLTISNRISTLDSFRINNYIGANIPNPYNAENSRLLYDIYPAHSNWKRMSKRDKIKSIDDKIIWIKNEIDNLANNPSYVPKVLSDVYVRPMVSLLTILSKMYGTYGLTYRLCDTANYIMHDGLITYAEHEQLMQYIMKYRPITAKGEIEWWGNGGYGKDKRKEWLSHHIWLQHNYKYIVKEGSYCEGDGEYVLAHEYTTDLSEFKSYFD